MSDTLEEAQRQLNAVRRDFEARLGSMVDEIVLAWEAAKGSSDQTVRMRNLIELVHRLAGNAGFFGFHEVSRTAMNLETALDRRLAATAFDRNDIQDLSRLVRTLQTQSGACTSDGA